MNHKLLKMALVAGSLGWGAVAYANPVSIEVNGTVEASGSGSTSTGPLSTGYNASLGGILVQTAAGDFVVASASVTGTPPLPQPDLDSATLDVSILSHCGGTGCITGGTLTVLMTETGLTAPLPMALSSFTTNLVTGDVTQVQEETFVDPGDTAFGTTDPLSSVTFTANGTSVKTSAATPPLTTYSITEEYIITASDTLGDCASPTTDGSTCGTANNTIDVSAAVPEPTSLVILGTALVGFGVARRRRRKAA